MHIYLHYGKAGHGLNSILDLLLHSQCHIRDAHTELHDNVQINSSLGLSYLNLYTLGKILLAENFCNAANQSAAHAGNALYLRSSHACNNAYHLVSDANRANALIQFNSIVCHRKNLLATKTGFTKYILPNIQALFKLF